MKPLFNEELDKGFQIDMSLLTEEQIEHVMQILQARGFIYANGCDKGFVAHIGEKTVWFGGLKDSTSPLIDYPTLCRASVQLENYNCMVSNITNCTRIWMLAKELYLTVSGFHNSDTNKLLRWSSNALESRANLRQYTEHYKLISPEEFEQRLSGVYPVVAKSEIAEKPKYFKSNDGNGLILKWIGDIPPSNFRAIVVDSGTTNNSIGDGDGVWWNKSQFEPCDEKPKYLKHKMNGFIIEVTLLEGDIFDGIIVECNEHSTLFKKGEKKTDLNVKYFEPCDYTPPQADRPFAGFQFVEDFPTTEQLEKTEMEKCLDKKLSDNPTTADSIGAHMQLAFEYSKQLVNENTRLRAQLYRLPILEQENAQLKSDANTDKATISRINEKLDEANEDKRDLEQENTSLENLLKVSKDLNVDQKARIAELENQLANLTSKPSPPIEPVYSKEWLEQCVYRMNPSYCLIHSVKQGMLVAMNDGGYCIDPKASAGIILEALAKELNPQFETDKEFSWEIYLKNGAYEAANNTISYGIASSIFTSREAAQKAIDILTQNFPEILTNYFKP